MLSPASQQPIKNGNPRSGRLRRIAAASAFTEHLDSSESCPSEHPSLGYGILLSFESELNYGCDQPRCRAAVVDGGSLQRAQEKAIRASYPVKKRIAPITERQAASFDSGNSRPASLAPSSTFNLTDPYNHISDLRVFSLDDLAILKRSRRPKAREPSRPNSFASHRRSSTSSSGSLEELSWLNEVVSPAEPTLPIQSPLERSPTPPGLPSFGTLEAINYQLPSRSQANNNRQLARTWAGAGVEGSNTESRLGSIRSIRRFLRRSISSTPSPPPLPPGAIARSDDGTYIRGRFGNRQSGHGVGGGRQSRGLECHPFHNSPMAAVSARQSASRAGRPVNHCNNSRPEDPSSARPRPQWRPPPYASLLDVPAPPPKKQKASSRQVRFADDAGYAEPQLASGAVREGVNRRSSRSSQHTAAPSSRRAGAYSSPLNMQLSTDGQDDEPRSQNAAVSDHGIWDRAKSDWLSWCCNEEQSNGEAENAPSNGPVNNDDTGATGIVADSRSDHSSPSSRNSVQDKLMSLRRRYITFFSTAWIPAWGWQPCGT